MERIDRQITEQGNKIRDLKGKKAAKPVIDEEVKALLELKAEFKKVAGKDWDPKGNNVPKEESPVAATEVGGGGGEIAALDAKIAAQGNRIRDLKGQKAGKEVIDAEVKTLLGLKAEFKKAAGKDWDPKGELW